MSRATIEALQKEIKILKQALAKADDALAAASQSHVIYASETNQTIGALIGIIQEQYNQILEMRVPGINPPMGSPPYPGYNERELKSPK